MPVSSYLAPVPSPSAGCLLQGPQPRWEPGALSQVGVKAEHSGARGEVDGVRWGQLLLQTPQGVCAKTVQRYFKLARDTG